MNRNIDFLAPDQPFRTSEKRLSEPILFQILRWGLAGMGFEHLVER
jgi:hypothetical protein